MAKFRLVVVDDHPIFREGVTAVLAAEPDIEIVGQGISAADAIELARELRPDVIILDINIPGGGLNASQTICDELPDVKIMILTGLPEEDLVLDALKAGAQAYVLKGVAARELISILHTVQAGERYVTPTLAASLLTQISSTILGMNAAEESDNTLTDREREILTLIADGESNKEIGKQLHLTEKTVKYYVTKILQKLRVHNRVQAALIAQQMRVGDRLS